MKSDRRGEDRPESRPRRGWARPSLRFNLLVLLFGLVILVVAFQHRRTLDATFARIVRKQESLPVQIAAVRSELASMELTREGLDRELKSRLAIAEDFRAEQFYLAIDTGNRRLRLHYGPEIVRDAAVVVGDARNVTFEGKTWEFAALKGALSVTGKLLDPAWPVPPWAYVVRNAPVPREPVTVPNGLGKYVILLPNGYVIHSPPSAQSPLTGAKPGSFMLAEADMRAIWPRIIAGTRVYIY